MTNHWLSVLVRCRYEPNFLPYLLALIRISICLIPQTGYLHPDEFFQSTDITGGHYFNSRIEPAWEFTTDTPIRCMLIPSILNYISFKIATLIQTKPSAYTLLVAPRLTYTLLSFVIDFCLYKLCHYYSNRGLWYLPVSIIFQTSFICLGCLTRTFSNVPEAVLFALLLVVVCQTVRPAFRILFVTQNRSTPINQRITRSKQLVSSTLIGFITTIGIFNRPTFPCFAIVPLCYWFVESWRRNCCKLSLMLQRVIAPIIVSGSLTLILISAFDTYYYKGANSISELLDAVKRFDLDNFMLRLSSTWVLTPYNFLTFNTSFKNLQRFGFHPPYFHMLVNIPFAFNVLGLLFYGKLFSLLVGQGIYRLIFNTHRIQSLMLTTILASSVLLSFIPHQEFRFLVPLIIPLVYTFSFNIYASNRLLPLWIFINVVLIYFYSSVHQSGITRACLDLDIILKKSTQEMHNGDQHIHVVALKSYMMPTYQWNIPVSENWFSTSGHTYRADFNSTITNTLKILTRCDGEQTRNFDVYFMLHRLYEDRLIDFIVDHLPQDNNYNLKVLQRYWPHFDGENLAESLSYVRQHGWRGLYKAFGFSLVNFKYTNLCEL